MDGKEKKYVYLEWDRKLDSNTTINQIQYNIFKNDLRKLITEIKNKKKIYQNYKNEQSYTKK